LCGFSGCFCGEQDVYVDKMHPNVKGYEIIAQAVYQVLKEKEPMLFKK
jgi:lysophospholipase L1-like esterase